MDPKDPAPLPVDELRAAAADQPGAHPGIDALHAAVTAENPDPDAIRRQVEHLRDTPVLVATLERWWMDPRTQAFIAELNATGL
ncbi:MAG: hypothetical protein ACLPYS_06140 [Vulcanimicrobiaceae bacterium]